MTKNKGSDCERKDCTWWGKSNSHNCSKPLETKYMGDDCPWNCYTEVKRDHSNCKEFDGTWWSKRPWKK